MSPTSSNMASQSLGKKFPPRYSFLRHRSPRHNAPNWFGNLSKRKSLTNAVGGIGRGIRSLRRISRYRKGKRIALSRTSKPISRFHGPTSTKRCTCLTIRENPISGRESAGVDAFPASERLLVFFRQRPESSQDLEVNRMCRNIKILFNFEPPVTDEEVHAASLQFVRKISGFHKPSKANESSFMAAVDEIAGVSTRLLRSLETNAPSRNREEEAAKAKARAVERFGT